MLSYLFVDGLQSILGKFIDCKYSSFQARYFLRKLDQVYFYFTRFIIPGELVSDGAYVCLVLTIIKQAHSILNLLLSILKRIFQVNSYSYAQFDSIKYFRYVGLPRSATP